MKSKLIIIATTALLASVSLAFDATSEFKKFMAATKPKVEMAFKKEDISFFEKTSTDDFSETQMGTKSNKKEALAGLKQFFGMVSNINCKYDLISATSDGKTGNAEVHSVMTCLMGGAAPKGSKMKPKAQKMEMEMWEKQVWVKQGKMWKLKSIADAKPMKMKVNGKAMDPAKAMGGGG